MQFNFFSLVSFNIWKSFILLSAQRSHATLHLNLCSTCLQSIISCSLKCSPVSSTLTLSSQNFFVCVTWDTILFLYICLSHFRNETVPEAFLRLKCCEQKDHCSLVSLSLVFILEGLKHRNKWKKIYITIWFAS